MWILQTFLLPKSVVLLPNIVLLSLCHSNSSFSLARTTRTAIPNVLQHHHRRTHVRFQKFATTALNVGDARGSYYGESAGSFMVKEFNTYEQLQEIVKLAAQPLPGDRPDGILTVVKYTTSTIADVRATEAEYERLARNNPSTLFLRCFAEYENANLLLGQASVSMLPTFDLFYQGNRVARVEGLNLIDLESAIDRYQFQNSKLDLFSEDTAKPWGEIRPRNPNQTPRTSNAFIPGYDWDKDKGFFDALADKAQSDFEAQFGNWLPNTDDK